jgi:hypothetical protein
MAMKTERVVLSGQTYLITTLGTDVGRKLFFRLMKIAGPSFAELLRSGIVGKPVAQWDVSLLSGAVMELVASLSEQDFELFYEAFLDVTRVTTAEGGEILLKDRRAIAFAGDYGTMTRWMYEHLKLNFSSFLAGWGITVPQDSSPAAQASIPPQA